MGRETAHTSWRVTVLEKKIILWLTGSGAGNAFVFGSELKSLRAFPGFSNPICRRALAQYMRFMYVPAPRSIKVFISWSQVA